MNKGYILYIIISLILGNSFAEKLWGQSYPAEQVSLLSDRNLFICGEEIQFSGLVSISEGSDNILSEVIYVELITPSGQKINRAKYRIENNTFSGQLRIPAEALSGYYFLRAYTKWMRNGAVEDYAYQLLKLVNPYQSELLELNDSLIIDSLKLNDEIAALDHLFALKNTYAPDEEIDLKKEAALADDFALACLSVVPALSEMGMLDQHFGDNYSSIEYMPETRGLSISGQVISKKDKEALAYQKVNLHLRDEKNFIAVMADSSARFNIALPDRKGRIELMVIASVEEGKEVEVLIDQDYCTREFNMAVAPFSLSEKERQQVLTMAQSLQLDDQYSTIDSTDLDSLKNIPFYGHADKSIDLDDFISLDSMSQYFTDLPSWIRIKKTNGKRSLIVESNESTLSYSDPLLLIDWVPVDDPENILKLDPRRIQKFEVITHSYIHGELIYGGVLNLFSRKNDFGGFEFPESAMYINFDFYHENSPKENSEQEVLLKNTSTWIPSINPELLTDGLSITAPSIPGSYVLVFQLVDMNGKIKQFEKAFEVN